MREYLKETDSGGPNSWIHSTGLHNESWIMSSTASILPREEKTLIERTKVWVFSFFLCWCWVCALNQVYTMDFCSIWFSSRIGFQCFYSMEQNYLSLCSTFFLPFISCTLVGILYALLCSVNFLCLWVI